MAGYGWPGDEPGDQDAGGLSDAERGAEYARRRYGAQSAVVLAALIFAGHRRWWEPPLVPPGEMLRGILGGGT